MHNQKFNLTKEYIKEKTQEQMTRFKSLVTKESKGFTDELKEKRNQQGLCKSCFYFRPVKLVMNAFWRQPCSICESEEIYHNSDTDVLCLPCAQKSGLCKKCGCEDF